MSEVPGIMIAAPKSGSGKTLITCALLGALKNRGIDVFSIKSGPDFIDPMFHRTVLGIDSYNLDTYFTDRKTTRELFLQDSAVHEMAVFEGVMGLFDGMGGTEIAGSSYDLACACEVPIILVVDTKGAARSVIPMIQGFLGYDKEGLIKGVILNNMSAHLYESLRARFCDEIPVPILGYFSHNKELNIESRHLGLVLPGERADINEMLGKASEALCESVDIDRILEIAGYTGFKDARKTKKTAPDKGVEDDVATFCPVKIAVARDEAFCFYYAENLRLLESFGAELIYFSPLEDDILPTQVDGLILGGGYPELYAGKLSENTSMLKSIRSAIDSGLPTIAECGGFMYLHETLVDADGNCFKLVGHIHGEVSYKGKAVRFGYAEFTDKTGEFLKYGSSIRGHEFHYYDSDRNGSDATATKPVTGKTWDCAHITETSFVGFPHLYYPSNPEFVRAFVEKCRE